ncbi:MAG: PKD domain-containing protein, partial [Flavobacteriales bacterium]|nr:PKD domain-containing protein [Flavobacteriales bacterium]
MKIFSMCAILTLSVISNTATSQTNSVECGTETTESDKIIYQQVRDQITSSQFQASKTSTGVPVSIHIIRRSNGTGGILPAQVSTALDVANYFFQEGGIRFYQCGPVNFIDDDNFYSFQKTVDETLCDINDVANTINIYFADYLYKVSGTDTTSLCGYAYLSGPKDRILMKNSCTMNGSTLSHELGHYFSLLHTHSSSFGAELTDGSNCSTAGDQFCDTPADPTLSYSTVTSSCDYTGSSTDANGQSYVPDVANIMSYSRKYCRSHFSMEQSDQMAFYLISYRNYLTCTEIPTVGFSPSAVSGCSGKSITFTDKSLSNPTTWNWTFTGGTPTTSNAANPQVVFDSSGTFSASLTAANSNGSGFNSLPVEVTIWDKTDLPFAEDFEGGTSIFSMYDTVVNSQSDIFVYGTSANTGSFGLALFGGASSTFFTPPDSVSFLANPSHFASFTIPCLDLILYETATLT